MSERLAKRIDGARHALKCLGRDFKMRGTNLHTLNKATRLLIELETHFRYADKFDVEDVVKRLRNGCTDKSRCKHDDCDCALMEEAAGFICELIAEKTQSSNSGIFNFDMKTAPQGGVLLELFGTYPESAEEMIVLGKWEHGGYTEGWVTATRYSVFYPTGWRQPILPWKELNSGPS